MFNYNLELAKTIFDLEMQRENLIKENKIREKLCPCRLKLLNQYISLSQLLTVRFTSKVIKFLEDFNRDKSYFDDLSLWYNNEMYEKFIKNNKTDIRMILLFKLLQEKYDNNFFETTSIKFKKLVTTYDENNFTNFEKGIIEIYDDIQEWMEIHIMGLLSLQLQCNNINLEILLDNEEFSSNGTIVENCPASESFKQEEVIRLYLTDETLEDESMCEYIKLIEKYHINISNISIIIDFDLVENVKELKDSMKMKMCECSNKYKSIKIVNTKDIKIDLNECGI